MSGQEIQARTISETVGEIRVSWWQQQQARSALALMARNGEIGAAFNPRRERTPASRTESGAVVPATDEWVCNYTRLAEPRSRTPRRVSIALAVLGAPVVVGGMLWHARHVIATGALIVLGIMLGVAGIIVLVNIIGSFGQRGAHCPGAWHK